MDFLNGKVALVTGGNRGIGLAIARSLVQEGARVVITGRDRAALEAAQRSLGAACEAAVCDVSDFPSVEACFRGVGERHGGLDILVNNAGIGIFKPVADLTPAEWRSVIDTNLTGAFYCTREAIPQMKKRGGGYIINISSLAGKNAFPGASAYNASKFGLNGFSEAVMLDVRYDNIKVSYVMPGSVATDFGSGSKGDWKLTAEDVAGTVLDLLRSRGGALSSRVEMRPFKPPRK